MMKTLISWSLPYILVLTKRTSSFSPIRLEPRIFSNKSLQSNRGHYHLSSSLSSTLSSHPTVPEAFAEENKLGSVTLLIPSTNDDTTVYKSKFGAKSPVSRPTYLSAAEQLARKISHFSDGRISTNVVSASGNDDEKETCLKANALIAFGLTSPADIRFLSEIFRERRTKQAFSPTPNTCQFAVECGTHTYAPIVGPYDEANPSIFATLAPWSDEASGKRLAEQMNDLFKKQTSDEFALALMLFFNRFSGDNVPWVQHSIDVTWEKGIVQNAKEIFAMITKCGPCIAKCLSDDNCSQCIKALDKIDTRDQVTSYRTIVSFESELLRDFSLCILQKNNIFECKAEIPTLPKVKPLSTFRGRDVTTETARGIIIGHLADTKESLEVGTFA